MIHPRMQFGRWFTHSSLQVWSWKYCCEYDYSVGYICRTNWIIESGVDIGQGWRGVGVSERSRLEGSRGQ